MTDVSEPSSDLVCPFCGATDFDLIGLKYHLTYCVNFAATETLPASPFAAIIPGTDASAVIEQDSEDAEYVKFRDELKLLGRHDLQIRIGLGKFADNVTDDQIRDAALEFFFPGKQSRRSAALDPVKAPKP